MAEMLLLQMLPKLTWINGCLQQLLASEFHNVQTCNQSSFDPAQLFSDWNRALAYQMQKMNWHHCSITKYNVDCWGKCVHTCAHCSTSSGLTTSTTAH